MNYFHLNGPSGFCYRADTLATARKYRAQFARMLSPSPWLYSVRLTIHASESPVNLWPIA